MNIQENTYYKKVFKKSWSFTNAAILLGLINVSMLAFTGKPWGVTTSFTYWGAWIMQAFGGHPEKWYFFQKKIDALNGGFFNDLHSLSNVGIILGALLATLLASRFRVKKIVSFHQLIPGIIGGLLMGYGARISFGCNIGALFSGVASMSVHGWMYWVFILIGASVGGIILEKYFM
ncbi:hypothetical protein SAMN00017405_0220 [Desulfonispora thiosulfatigenes DSM 11270]|uniref:Uncharacterized protein n=1 Tax=Desulfonispora thiosulfatigenes DSM 11270 TaxID=656914 RepID=A0A1W1VMP8_DESTI|nr:YeeE/YedE thiosulfate transporter family protein [Desulfonispora thiosulfatigenes]SMB94500.1 hypothetical protein SAMN00017405_0220 [Desulfonispora thiosulfatigenes DSM 11270]